VALLTSETKRTLIRRQRVAPHKCSSTPAMEWSSRATSGLDDGKTRSLPSDNNAAYQLLTQAIESYKAKHEGNPPDELFVHGRVSLEEPDERLFGSGRKTHEGHRRKN